MAIQYLSGINVRGNVGIGTTSLGAKLDVFATPTAAWMNLINSDETAFRLTTYNNGTNNGSSAYAFKHGLYYNTTENAAVTFWRGGSGTGGFLTFTTNNGAERMRIDSSGNVGIGTTSPGYNLVVGNGTQNTESRFYFGDGSYTSASGYGLYMSRTFSYIRPVTDENQTLNIGALNSAWGTISNNASLHTFGKDSNEFMRINSSGNVGIGTTSPNTALEVDGAITTTTSDYVQGSTGSRLILETAGAGNTHSFIQAQNSGGNSNSEDLALQLYGGNLGVGLAIPLEKLHVNGSLELQSGFHISSTDGNYWQRIRTEDGSASTTNAFNFETRNGSGAYLQHMVIRNDGNVGIGTTSPGAKLDVVGNVNTDNSISIQGLDTGNPSASSEELRLSGYGLLGNRSAMYITNGHATGTMRFGVGGSGGNHGSNTKMVLNSSGNLGIGTTIPSKRLQVSHSDANNGLLLEHTSQASGFQILQNIRQTEGLIWQKQTNDSFTSNLMTLGYDGDLGIGTTSPGSLLHVEGSRTTAALQVNQTGTGVIANFKQGGSSKVLIDNSGNVGIGTTSLSNKLQVTGSTQSTDFKVGSSGTMQLFDYSGNLHIYSTAGTDILLGGGIGGRQNDVTIGNGDLRVSGSVKMGNDSDAASAGKAGALRYRTSGNNSYVDMCMRTGATTYAWVNIVQNNW
jgi:hypothetical protein